MVMLKNVERYHFISPTGNISVTATMICVLSLRSLLTVSLIGFSDIIRLRGSADIAIVFRHDELINLVGS